MTTNPITAIRSSFAQLIPAMAADYAAHINRQIDRLEDRYGNVARIPRKDASLGIGSEVRTFMMPADGAAANRPGAPVVRDVERIERFAQQNAEDVVEGFVRKLESKLGDLDTVEMSRTDGARFTLTGTLGGRRVRVEQQVVFKASSRGKLYHQFPARIYVDGQFTPEADFKALTR